MGQEIDAIIRQIARENHVRPEDVLRDMQQAIDAAYADPAVRDVWKVMYPKGKPTPQEFIRSMAERMR